MLSVCLLFAIEIRLFLQTSILAPLFFLYQLGSIFVTPTFTVLTHTAD